MTAAESALCLENGQTCSPDKNFNISEAVRKMKRSELIKNVGSRACQGRGQTCRVAN